jgi:hypothetical protein
MNGTAATAARVVARAVVVSHGSSSSASGVQDPSSGVPKSYSPEKSSVNENVAVEAFPVAGRHRREG